MDVRCAQCQAEYELDDTLVAERGTAVCCTRCGFRFRAYRPAGVAGAPERWTVQTAAGETLTFLSLRALQEAIVLRRVGPQDALTRGLGPARSLASIVEFRSLFDAVRRGGEALAKARPSLPTPVGLGNPSRPSMPFGLGDSGRPSMPFGPGNPSRPSMPFGLGGHARASLGPSGLTAPPGQPPGGGVAGAPGLPARPARVPSELAPPDLTTTPPTGLVMPRGEGRSGAALPSMVRTIPFGEEYEKPVREAVEAALGWPSGASEGVARAAAEAGRGPAARPAGYPAETTAPLFPGTAGHEGPRAAVSRGSGGTLVNAMTPQVFVASGVVTPPDGRSRLPLSRAIGDEPGRERRLSDGLSSGAAARGEGAARRAGASTSDAPPWGAPRPPAAPPLRWFVLAAAGLALAAGVGLRAGLGPSAREGAPAAAPADAGNVDELVAAAEAAFGRGDVDAAAEAYAKAKALGRGDARVALGGARAAVLRAEGGWWRQRLVPGPDGGLAESAGLASRAVDEAAEAAPGEGKVLALRVDARRLAGDLPAARALAASLPAAGGADASYARAALGLAEGAPIDAEALGRLREAAAGEPAPGRGAAALVYALALAGEGPAARAEFARMASAPTSFAALPELRAWLDARAGKAAGPAPGAGAPPAHAGAPPKRRPRAKPGHAVPAWRSPSEPREPARAGAGAARGAPGGGSGGEPGGAVDEASGRPAAAGEGAGAPTEPAPAGEGAAPKLAPTATAAPKPADEGGATTEGQDSP